jgi:hypothetical protein
MARLAEEQARNASIIHRYLYTDKKENKIFVIFKEISKGAVAKSYMTKNLRISSPHI